MTEKMITLKFILPEALAVAFGIIILIGIVYLTHKYPVPTVQADANHSAGGSLRKRELPNRTDRASMAHALLYPPPIARPPGGMLAGLSW